MEIIKKSLLLSLGLLISLTSSFCYSMRKVKSNVHIYEYEPSPTIRIPGRRRSMRERAVLDQLAKAEYRLLEELEQEKQEELKNNVPETKNPKKSPKSRKYTGTRKLKIHRKKGQRTQKTFSRPCLSVQRSNAPRTQEFVYPKEDTKKVLQLWEILEKLKKQEQEERRERIRITKECERDGLMWPIEL